MTVFNQDLLFEWKQHQAKNLVHNRRYNWNTSHQRLGLYYCTGVWTGAKPLQFREDQHNLYHLEDKKGLVFYREGEEDYEDPEQKAGQFPTLNYW